MTLAAGALQSWCSAAQLHRARPMNAARDHPLALCTRDRSQPRIALFFWRACSSGLTGPLRRGEHLSSELLGL